MTLIIWIIVQCIIGLHFFMPVFLIVFSSLRRKKPFPETFIQQEPDYAIIVTAYQQTNQLPAVVQSLLNLRYDHFLIYIVADNCDISGLDFHSDKVVLLRPEETLSSNVKSHFYAISHFRRNHERLSIIDSDNLVDRDYLKELNIFFSAGYEAVQGVRKAKNLTSVYACLDEAGDIYYRYVDRKLMFAGGSSAALSGSGMAFTTQLYIDCLGDKPLEGAGFDKVLQYEIIRRGKKIAFSENAVLYDEKTSKTGQLVNQRSRWINTWFRFAYLGVKLLKNALVRFDWNQFLFSLQLLRPPLFLLVGLSGLSVLLNIWVQPIYDLIWALAALSFLTVFFRALFYFKADHKIYQALKGVPRFIFYQLKALMKAKQANKISVATEHYEHADDGLKK